MSDAPDIITLQARLEAAESETIEQARLLGMSGEREAKHLALIEDLEKALGGEQIDGVWLTALRLKSREDEVAQAEATIVFLRQQLAELVKLVIPASHHEAALAQPVSWQAEQVRSAIYSLRQKLDKLALTDSGGDVSTGSTRRVDASKNTQEIDKCAPIIDAAMSATGGAR